MFKNGMRPVYLGEVLYEEYMQPIGLSSDVLAKALNVPLLCVEELVGGQQGITESLAQGLASYFGTDSQSWLELQHNYSLRVAEIVNSRRL
jgi:addiction module HigA family antidote